MSDISRYELVSTMLGRELAEQLSHRRAAEDDALAATPPMLEAVDLRRGRALDGVSVSIRPGEIVGLAGLLGSGRTETARAIFGADPLDSGTVALDGTAAEPARRRATRSGTRSASPPEDRKTEGIIAAALGAREPHARAAAAPAPPRHRRPQAPDRDRRPVHQGDRHQVLEPGPARSGSSPAGTSRRCCWPAGCAPTRSCSSSTSPPAASTSAPSATSRCSSGSSPTRASAVLLISSELEEIIADSDRVVTLRDGRSVAELARRRHHRGRAHAGDGDGCRRRRPHPTQARGGASA